MRAVVFPRYGPPDVLEIRDLPKPTPRDDEVLVRVRAASVNIAEWYQMTGLFLARIGNGLRRPNDIRLGADFAGVVEQVGLAVADFRVGDQVFGGRSGALADYVTVGSNLTHKPTNVTFEEAAAVPTAAVTALQGLRDHGALQPGQRVLINGASGGVGTFAIQIAKALGAEVIAVCSPRNLEQARTLGADQVVDYTRHDFTREAPPVDLLLDIVGSRSWFACRRVLTPEARVVIVGGPRTPWIGPLSHVLRMRLASLGSSRKIIFFVAHFNRQDFEALRDLIQSGRVRPVVQQTFPLAGVAEAMRVLGTGHAQAKLVVRMD